MNEESPSDLIEQGHEQARRGNLQGSITWYERAATLARTEGNDESEMDALYELSVAYDNMGENQKCIEMASHLLARARQVQNEQYQMQATFALAATLAYLDLPGRWRELKPLLLEGRQIARDLGDRSFEIMHLIWLGDCTIEMGGEEEGFSILQEALNLIRPELVDCDYLFGKVYKALSQLMYKRGVYVEAIRYAEMSIGAFQKYGYPDHVVGVQLELARARHAQGESSEARRLIRHAWLQGRKMHVKYIEQKAEYLISELERDSGHHREAETAARQALKLAQEMKEKEPEVKSMLMLGQALLANKQLTEAREVLTQAHRLSQERDYADHFNKAEELLEGIDSSADAI